MRTDRFPETDQSPELPAQAPEDVSPNDGHRLVSTHYEPDRIPLQVARYVGGTAALPAGNPGKVGLLELEFGRTPHGTELVEHHQKAPLQIMQPLYYDPARPDMPYTYLMLKGAGMMQGDRLRTDIAFGAGSSGNVTTSACTNVLGMERDLAVSQTNIALGADAYVEYLPEPVVLFADARLYQRTCLTLPPSATAIIAETLVAGRLARDERHQYTVLASDIEVSRPDGSVVAIDRMRLSPADGSHSALAVLDEHDVISRMFVLTTTTSVREVSDLLHEVLTPCAETGVVFGLSALPADSGVWVRLLGDDTRSVTDAVTAAWQSLRLLLTGNEAPLVRKS